jgi:SAM-dependent methyltransferase
VGVGEDFEYRCSADSFLAVRCRHCRIVYLDPRPSAASFGRIYPDNYHAFDFSEAKFGLAFRVRSWLEARRLLGLCRDLPSDARILDVGCGDGFHLSLLRRHGRPGWQLEGVDLDARAAEAARRHGLAIHEGRIEQLDLPRDSYDLAFMIQTVEHLDDPAGTVRAVHRVLKPGGRLVIVTDNTATLDFAIFCGRHWGGYHFPRHLQLFNRGAMARFAAVCGFEPVSIRTIVSPVNWVYSVRNLLDDWGASPWWVRRFSLSAPVALAAFTLIDNLSRLLGHGALLRAVLRRPRSEVP